MLIVHFYLSVSVLFCCFVLHTLCRQIISCWRNMHKPKKMNEKEKKKKYLLWLLLPFYCLCNYYLVCLLFVSIVDWSNIITNQINYWFHPALFNLCGRAITTSTSIKNKLFQRYVCVLSFTMCFHLFRHVFFPFSVDFLFCDQ